MCFRDEINGRGIELALFDVQRTIKAGYAVAARHLLLADLNG
jgi:hypothetical protein